ncbi:hypothetical protein WN48_10727 [Eufriesea mexicana]|uniref:Uncharacterized protein n=1 Tax=Eufriesea mexicana TaxID=516756 RepID=A0A310SCX1_9HYME|nr:hypothetical protein WN48_10727 [Eufriesea mexicana]
MSASNIIPSLYRATTRVMIVLFKIPAKNAIDSNTIVPARSGIAQMGQLSNGQESRYPCK